MSNLFAKIKRRVFRRPVVETQPVSAMTALNPQYAKYSIGDWTYGAPIVQCWNQDATLSIGKFCSIADGAMILLGGEHRPDWVTTYPFRELVFDRPEVAAIGYSKGDVSVGNDVWLGYNSLILSGVTISHGAIIAAGAVVTKDVPAYAIVGGNPAKIIRYRIPESLIAPMQEIAWWNWPLDQIEAALPLLLSADIERFVHTYGTSERR